MRPTAQLALLLAAAVVAAALPASAAAVPNFDVCETYNKEECLEHADKCTPCKAWDKLDVCFETQIAMRLPTKLFTCSFAPPPPPPAEPDTDCQSLTDEVSCSDAPTCVWCLSAAVPSACYTEAEARRLPAAVFRCKFPSLAAQQ